MEGAPTLLTGRITRSAMAWLVGAVLITIPLEAWAYDDPLVSGTIPLRAGALMLILLGLKTCRLSAVEAGQLFVAQGLITMVCWTALLDHDPSRVAMEAIAYGTIMPICTLLIAPRQNRRLWAIFVYALVQFTAISRLMPDDLGLLAQVIVILTLHGGAIALLDTHTDKAELAGAMADIDDLTGLINRGAAMREMNAIVDGEPRREPSSLVLLDLDRFKQLNDTLGHEAGDQALRRAAQVLTAFVRPSDIACRWGGEEFVIVLPGTDEALAAATAELLRLRLADTGVTASFGVAELDAGDTVNTWVRRADDAMYVAKREGRNAVRIAARQHA